MIKSLTWKRVFIWKKYGQFFFDEKNRFQFIQKTKPC